MSVLRPMRAPLAGLAMAAMLAGRAIAQPTLDPVDPQRLALAEQIYAMTGRETVQGLGRALTAMMSAPLRNVSDQDPVRAAAVQAALGDSIANLMPQVLHATARNMAQDFTIEQLKAILAFYQSPAGQAMLQKTPLLTQQAIQISTSLLPSFMEGFEADYCKRVTCTEQEKNVFAQVNARMAQAARAQDQAQAAHATAATP